MGETIPGMILELAEQRARHAALRHKSDDVYRDISWQELGENIRRYARALLAAGVEPGDRVAIMSPNGPAWVFADLSIMACGAVTVPIYHTEGPEAIKHVLADSGSRILFLFSSLLAADLTRELDDLPKLEHIVLLQKSLDHDKIQRLEKFLGDGKAEADEELSRRLAAAEAEDLATIVYTSGTTGSPKGVCLTHRNLFTNIEDCREIFPIGEEDVCLSFLPLSHVFERVDGYYFMLRSGVVIAYAESIETVPQNMAEVRPTVIVSVPRLYEKMHSRVLDRVLEGPWLRKQIFFAALKAARLYVQRQNAGQDPGTLLTKVVKAARKSVFSKLNDRLGGRLRFFISGGAPLGREIAEFFQAAGVPIYEGYGLSESAGGIAVNTPDMHRLGTAGKPFPSTEVRIAEDGEILLKGPAIFKGYYKRPQETKEALEDGWFKTGDIGQLDAQGFLSIIDRKKDLIVTAGGENIAPQPIENLLKRDKFITNAMVYGDGKPYLTALIVPNFEKLESWADEKGIDYLDNCGLVSHAQVLELLRERIDALQKGMAPIKRIKRFTLLSADFSKDEVTPTLKVRRKVVTKHFRSILEGMYLAEDHGVHDSGFCVVEEAGNG